MPGKHGMSNHFRNVILHFHEQMPLFNIRERREQARLDPRLFTFKISQKLLDLHPLPVRVAARRAGTAGDRKTRQRRIADDIVLRHIHERPDHDISSVISPEQGGHRLDLAVIELIEQQRLDEVVALMTRAIFVQPSSAARVYNTPRRIREQREQGESPGPSCSSIILWIGAQTTSFSTPFSHTYD